MCVDPVCFRPEEPLAAARQSFLNSDWKVSVLQMVTLGGGSRGQQPEMYHFDHVPKLKKDHHWSENHPGVRAAANGYQVRYLL